MEFGVVPGWWDGLQCAVVPGPLPRPHRSLPIFHLGLPDQPPLGFVKVAEVCPVQVEPNGCAIRCHLLGDGRRSSSGFQSRWDGPSGLELDSAFLGLHLKGRELGHRRTASTSAATMCPPFNDAFTFGCPHQGFRDPLVDMVGRRSAVSGGSQPLHWLPSSWHLAATGFRPQCKAASIRSRTAACGFFLLRLPLGVLDCLLLWRGRDIPAGFVHHLFNRASGGVVSFWKGLPWCAAHGCTGGDQQGLFRLGQLPVIGTAPLRDFVHDVINLPLVAVV